MVIDRTYRVARQRWCCMVVAFAALGLVACDDHPEDTLLGCWTESEWRYERADLPAGTPMGRWTDGIRSREHADRRIHRHEAEYWDFRPGGDIVIGARDGSEARARWRLKGRGHVLTVRFPGSGDLEVYKIQELAGDELVLHYDVGMEVRGIARLAFRRAGRPTAGGPSRSCTSRVAQGSAPVGGRS